MDELRRIQHGVHHRKPCLHHRKPCLHHRKACPRAYVSATTQACLVTAGNPAAAFVALSSAPEIAMLQFMCDAGWGKFNHAQQLPLQSLRVKSPSGRADATLRMQKILYTFLSFV
jgi:hypothetical protein